MLVKFFGEKYLAAMDKYMMVIPACPHCVHAGKVPDEKLKVNEPWGQMCVTEPNQSLADVHQVHQIEVTSILTVTSAFLMSILSQCGSF